ncbi:unnamed protein product, partial [Rotaria sordida]
SSIENSIASLFHLPIDEHRLSHSNNSHVEIPHELEK